MKRTLASLIILLLSVPLLRAAHVDTVSIHSNGMGKDLRCVLIMPDTMLAPRLPVVYLLNGYSGDHSSWVKGAPVIKELADRMQVMIVCPDGGYNSWYYDSPVDPSSKYETFVAGEAVRFIDRTYPTIPDRRHRAIAGLSMGGHGALFLALRHPDIFGAAGSMSGGVDIRPFKTRWKLTEVLGDTMACREHWDSLTVMTMIDRYPADSLELIIDCGTEDFFFEVNRRLHERLLALKVPHDYIERPGVHNWAYWNNAVRYQMLFFKTFFDRSAR